MAGLGGVILQGLCTLAWGVDAFARFLGDPGLVTAVKARFSKPVRPEDTVRFDGTVTEVSGGRVKAAVVARNQSGDEVLKNVVVEGRVRTPGEPAGGAGVPGMTARRGSCRGGAPDVAPGAPGGGAAAALLGTLAGDGRGGDARRRDRTHGARPDVGPFRYAMGAEKMREYAVAISGGVPSYISTGLPEDLHPVLHDEAAAARSAWRSLIAFPMFAVLFSIAPAQAALLDPAMEVDVFRVLHGEQEFDFLEVLRPGTCSSPPAPSSRARCGGTTSCSSSAPTR